MFFSGGQCGYVRRPEELLLMFKVALVVIFLHITLATSLEGKMLIFLYLFFLFYQCVCLCVWDFFYNGKISVKHFNNF